VDTLVDPIETLSSSHMRAAAPAPGTRASLQSVDPEGEVQWFSRLPEESSVDIEIAWDARDDEDSCPTLVIARAQTC
jgi:hypothetical protein